LKFANSYILIAKINKRIIKFYFREVLVLWLK
jgi:hypothetical protein